MSRRTSESSSDTALRGCTNQLRTYDIRSSSGHLLLIPAAISAAATCRCELAFSAVNFDEVALDCPAVVFRLSGKQLTSHAQVVGRVPLDSLAVDGHQPRHGA